MTVQPQSEAQLDWGWTSYRREPWLIQGDDGIERRCYRARFRSQPTRTSAGRSWEERTIVFCAQRPILALRTIANSGKDPLEFDGRQIN